MHTITWAKLVSGTGCGSHPTFNHNEVVMGAFIGVNQLSFKFCEAFLFKAAVSPSDDLTCQVCQFLKRNSAIVMERLSSFENAGL